MPGKETVNAGNFPGEGHLIQRYDDAMAGIDKEAVMAVIDKALNQGVLPKDIIFQWVVPGIEKMQEALLYQKQASMARHYLAVTLAESVVDSLLPLLTPQESEMAGVVILGCSCGDVHGLGKKIVGSCLKTHLFKIIDLGIDVPAERFVDEAIQHDAHIIGISSMMVHTALGNLGPKKVKEILLSQHLENKIKIIVGGAPYLFDANLYRQTGADMWAKDGIEAVHCIQKLLKEVNHV